MIVQHSAFIIISAECQLVQLLMLPTHLIRRLTEVVTETSSDRQPDISIGISRQNTSFNELQQSEVSVAMVSVNR